MSIYSDIAADGDIVDAVVADVRCSNCGHTNEIFWQAWLPTTKNMRNLMAMEKDVDEAEAQRLLTTFPHMFQLVDKRGRPPVLRKEVERRFSKSINQLLYERKDKSLREIAKELGVSKSLIAKWRKRYFD